MEQGKIEILLIELSGASIKNKLAWKQSLSRLAPIGLYCLKAIAPERIALIDVPVANVADMLKVYSATTLKAIICRLPYEADKELLASIFASIKETFPEVSLGCNQVSDEVTKSFDFVINGSGKASILRILRGDELCGLCDESSNNGLDVVDLPKELLVDTGYDILPEKWLSVHNIEVCQPWLGLEEFSLNLFSYPGQDWIVQLLSWLKDSGFDSVHFNPSGWVAEDISRLRPVVLKLNLTLSLSFMATTPMNFADIITPAKRIWLCYPQAINGDEVVEKLKAIKAAGFEACLEIDHSWFGGGITLPACKYIDRLIIKDDYLWSTQELKKFTQRFWGTKTRFFKRLFSLRTAAELVVFMKSSYALLEVLFLSDNKVVSK